jgi:alpha-mannosidase/mannosylglycerate hydrolase
VDNTCKDHRLRVFFPSGCKADTYLADSAFDVVERKIRLPEDNHLARELTVETTPQQTWTAISQGKRGLAVVSTGLMESCVRDLPERPLALTLFRSTRKTVMTDGQPEGQLQGKMQFNYWIVPLAGKTGLRHLCDVGTQLAAGIRTAQLRKGDFVPHNGGKKLPASASFLKIEGEVVTTSIRKIDEAMEVRLFNPNTRKTEAALHFGNWPTGAKRPTTMVRVNLESIPMGKKKKFLSIVRVSLKPKEIVTLQFA